MAASRVGKARGRSRPRLTGTAKLGWVCALVALAATPIAAQPPYGHGPVPPYYTSLGRWTGVGLYIGVLQTPHGECCNQNDLQFLDERLQTVAVLYARHDGQKLTFDAKERERAGRRWPHLAELEAHLAGAVPHAPGNSDGAEALAQKTLEFIAAHGGRVDFDRRNCNAVPWPLVSTAGWQPVRPFADCFFEGERLAAILASSSQVEPAGELAALRAALDRAILGEVPETQQPIVAFAKGPAGELRALPVVQVAAGSAFEPLGFTERNELVFSFSPYWQSAKRPKARLAFDLRAQSLRVVDGDSALRPAEVSPTPTEAHRFESGDTLAARTVVDHELRPSESDAEEPQLVATGTSVILTSAGGGTARASTFEVRRPDQIRPVAIVRSPSDSRVVVVAYTQTSGRRAFGTSGLSSAMFVLAAIDTAKLSRPRFDPVPVAARIHALGFSPASLFAFRDERGPIPRLTIVDLKTDRVVHEGPASAGTRELTKRGVRPVAREQLERGRLGSVFDRGRQDDPTRPPPPVSLTLPDAWFAFAVQDERLLAVRYDLDGAIAGGKYLATVGSAEQETLRQHLDAPWVKSSLEERLAIFFPSRLVGMHLAHGFRPPEGCDLPRRMALQAPPPPTVASPCASVGDADEFRRPEMSMTAYTGSGVAALEPGSPVRTIEQRCEFGQREGPARAYDAHGKLVWESYFHDDLETGLRVTYDANGVAVGATFYEAGQLVWAEAGHPAKNLGVAPTGRCPADGRLCIGGLLHGLVADRPSGGSEYDEREQQYYRGVPVGISRESRLSFVYLRDGREIWRERVSLARDGQSPQRVVKRTLSDGEVFFHTAGSLQMRPPNQRYRHAVAALAGDVQFERVTYSLVRGKPHGLHAEFDGPGLVYRCYRDGVRVAGRFFADP